MDNVWLAFGLTTIAGLSTGIGSAIGFAKRTNTVFVFQPWFSAGVMIFVSMIEIYPKAQTVLSSELGSRSGGWVTAIAFFAGILLIAVIDKLIPSAKIPRDASGGRVVRRWCLLFETNLLRTGVFTALAVAIHNFPEG